MISATGILTKQQRPKGSGTKESAQDDIPAPPWLKRAPISTQKCEWNPRSIWDFQSVNREESRVSGPRKRPQRGRICVLRGNCRRGTGNILSDVLTMWKAFVVSGVAWKWAPISLTEFSPIFRHNRQLHKALSVLATPWVRAWLEFCHRISHQTLENCAVKFLEGRLHEGIKFSWSNFEEPWFS